MDIPKNTLDKKTGIKRKPSLPGRLRWLFVFLVVFILSAAIAVPARAQTATPPTPRDVLIQAITDQAQRDEKKGVQESTEG